MEVDLEYPSFIPEKALALFQNMNTLFRQILEIKQHVYKKDALEIIISKTPATKKWVDVVHHGWKCPSMYHDSPPENGIGHTLFLVKNPEENDDFISFMLEFTSDDYAVSTYLKFEFSSNFKSITILEGQYKGELLTLQE